MNKIIFTLKLFSKWKQNTHLSYVSSGQIFNVMLTKEVQYLFFLSYIVYFVALLLEQITNCYSDLCTETFWIEFWLTFSPIPQVNICRWQHEYFVALWLCISDYCEPSQQKRYKPHCLFYSFEPDWTSVSQKNCTFIVNPCVRSELELVIYNVKILCYAYILSRPWQFHVHGRTTFKILLNLDPNAVLWTNIEPSREVCLPYKARLKAIKISQED